MSMQTPTALAASLLRLVGLAAMIGGLHGCALPPAPATGSMPDSPCGSELNPTDNTRLAGVEQVLREGKPYAALAQLDALAAQGLRNPQVDLARADALRRIDRPHEAEALYRSQLGGCLQGRAWHGLGLLQAQRGQSIDSLASLERARNLQPTDTRVRNDFGYALLLAQRLDDARFEFLTVLELAPGDARAARNLVLLTLREGRADKARELAASLGLDAATVARLAQTSAELTAPVGASAPNAAQP